MPASRRRVALALVAGATVAAGLGAATADPGPRVTIYREHSPALPAYYYEEAYEPADYGAAPAPPAAGAVVIDERTFDLVAGEQLVRVTGVPRRLDGGSVHLASRRDADGITIARQRLVVDDDPDGLLGRHLGATIAVVTAGGEVRGTLRAFSATQLIIETGEPEFPLQVLRRAGYVEAIRLPGAPGAGEVAGSPALEWRLRATRAGAHPVTLTYRTEGLSWRADYSAILDEGAGTGDLSAWVTIENGSGMDLRAASVTLVDQQRGVPQANAYGTLVQAPVRTTWRRTFQGVDVDDGQSVQLELAASARQVPMRPVNLYEAMLDYSPYNYGQPQPAQDCYAYQYHQPMSGTSATFLEAAGGGDGALPSGTVRVYRRGGDGTMELLAEERADPEAAGGRLRVRLAAPSPIRGQRLQVRCEPDPGGRAVTDTFELQVINDTAQAEEVVVRDYMQRWSQWRVEKESHPGRRAGRAGYEWRVRLEPGATETVTYTVRYWW